MGEVVKITRIFFLVNPSKSQYFYDRPLCPNGFSNERFVISFDETHQKVECSFNVTKVNPNICGIQLNFKNFALRNTPHCHDEFLEFNRKRICGSVFGGQNVSFSSNTMTFSFRGLGEQPVVIEAQQMQCTQPQKTTCDVTSTRIQTEIASPSFPHPYPVPSHCRYTIITPELCHVQIKFLEFYLPESPKCEQSHFKIDNEPICGTHTGSILRKNISGLLTMEFSANVTHPFGKYHVIVDRLNCVNYTARQFQSAPICCGHVFSSLRSVFTSPNFLMSSGGSTCAYIITPNNPSICRMRINFHHFWLGDEDVYYGCTNGYLEVDGRKYCGCKDGIYIMSYFNGPKELIFSSNGSPTRGFVIEVVQEDCTGFDVQRFPESTTQGNPNTEVEVFSINSTEKFESRFFVPADGSRCYQWGTPNWSEKIHGIVASFGAEKCNSGFAYPVPPIIPPPNPVPPFIPPPNPVPPIIPPPNPVPPIIPPPNPVPPIIPPPNPVPPIIPPPNPVPPFIPPLNPVPPIIPPQIPVPPIIPPPFPSRNPYGCQVFSTVVGSFQSPNFPWNYPPSLRCCYRIRQLPGFCSVQLTFFDFQVEWSPKCWKDYVFINRRERFCGTSLQSSYVDLFFQGGYAYVDFLTDQFWSGRGFRALFRQIPCRFDSRLQCDHPRRNDSSNNQTTTPIPNNEDDFNLGVTAV